MKVAIVGYGVEGKSNYKYYASDLRNQVDVFDENPNVTADPDVNITVGEGCLNNLNGYDLIVRTAGFDPKKLTGKGKIWSATNEFFARCPATIVGVTGTKGKGTTASLVASVLKATGKTVHLLGNIGVPSLDILPSIQPSDIVVYELSSFQLWDLEKSPHIAVVLMIEPDHLDVHANFEEYVDAKKNICRWQSEDDICIYHPTNEYSAEIASGGNGSKKRYAIREDGQVYVENGFFHINDLQICPVESLKLPGKHNIENACAAMSAVEALGLGISNDTYEQGLGDFTGLPHRLKFVREVDGISYYDDSIATTPGSAIAALRAFPGKDKVIILGGKGKGADYRELLSIVKGTNSKVIIIGEDSSDIARLAEENGIEYRKVEGLMDEVVSVAYGMATEGGVAILSPAAASFDQYKSYSDRGEQFVRAVEEL